jgi:hypothetical protein
MRTAETAVESFGLRKVVDRGKTSPVSNRRRQSQARRISLRMGGS